MVDSGTACPLFSVLCGVSVCACLRAHHQASDKGLAGDQGRGVTTTVCAVITHSPTVDIVPKRKKHGALAKLICSGSLPRRLDTHSHTPLPVLDQIHIVEDRDEYKTLAEPVCSLFVSIPSHT